jgi:hypothetical protein
MRFLYLLIVAAMATPAVALELPDPANADAKAMVAQYVKDKALIDSPGLLVAPNPAPEWPCEFPEIERYKIAGLQMAHPELARDIEKATRKALREMSPGTSMPTTTYSNVRFIPLKAQCQDGKLDGELQLLVSYDQRMETKSKTQLGEKVVNGVTAIISHNLIRIHASVKAGIGQGGQSRFSEITTTVETHYDDAQMGATAQKFASKKPTVIRNTVYSNGAGNTGTFSQIDDVQVSGGLFPSVKTVPAMSTMFMVKIDEHRMRMESYKNKQLITISSIKDGKPHGEALMYMPNVYKKLNLRLDQQPNMQNARELTIDGVDMIETHNCFANGVQVKTATCSDE